MSSLVSIRREDYRHVCLIYPKTDEQIRTTVALLRLFILRGEKVTYVTDHSSPLDIMDSLSKAGVDVGSAIDRGAFALPSKKDVFFKQGHFDPDSVVGFLREMAMCAKSMSFTRYSMIGEMTWALDPALSEGRLFEYEVKINRFLEEQDALVVCQYDKNLLSSDSLSDIMRTHPHILHSDTVCRNFYYVPSGGPIEEGEVSFTADRWLGNIFDRQRIEDQLREKEIQQSTFLAHSVVGIYRMTPEGQVILANPTLVGLLGYTSYEDLMEMNLKERDFVAPQRRSVFKNTLERDGEVKGLESVWSRLDGSEVVVREYTWPVRGDDDEVLYYEGTVEDITETRELAEALVLSEHELETQVKERTKKINVAKRNLQKELEVQKQVEEMLYCERADLKKRLNELNCFYVISEFADEKDNHIDDVVRRIVEVLPTAFDLPETICTRIRLRGIEYKSGNYMDTPTRLDHELALHGTAVGSFEVGMFPVEHEEIGRVFAEGEERLVKTIAELLDRLIDQKWDEEDLKISNTEIESSMAGSVVTDIQGAITYTNRAFLNLWGYTSDKDLLGKPLAAMWQSREEFESILDSLRRLGKWSGELTAERRDGSLCDVHLSVSFVYDDKGTPVRIVASVADITELKQLQDRLIRTERLAASGELATFIAHEINSPLQAISIILGTLRQKQDGDSEISEQIDLLRDAFGDIKDTVSNLLDLNRQGGKKQSVYVNRVIQNTLSLVKGYLKKNRVKANLDLCATIPNVPASPRELSQVFLNLINNAVEAMTGVSSLNGEDDITAKGGEISIRTGLEQGNIVIQFFDSGPGIAEEDLEHLFAPFYTRKKKMGLGVGLSICRGIIEDHGGRISVANSSSGGAVFTIVLPVR